MHYNQPKEEGDNVFHINQKIEDETIQKEKNIDIWKTK